MNPNTRDDIDALSTSDRDAFMRRLGQSTWRVERDDANETYVAVRDSTTISRFGFTLDDFASVSSPTLPEWSPAVVPITEQVTRLQARLALIDAGLWDAVTAYFADPARTPAELAFWEDAQTWYRNDPVIAAAGTALGLTPEQIDTLFIDAKTR